MSDATKVSILKEVIPDSLRQVVRHRKPKDFEELKTSLKEEATEHREATEANEYRAGTSLHQVAEERLEQREEVDQRRGDYGEEETYYWDYVLASFVPRGKGKGKSKGKR